MITVQEYIENPCGTLSIPYWKAKTFKLPKHMKIVHEDDFNDSYLLDYKDVPYFRLVHPMGDISEKVDDRYGIKTASILDIETIVHIINKSYVDIQVTHDQIQSYTDTEVYREDLWILVYDTDTNEVVGCGIADFDKEVEEGVLEWIQVLPEHRHKGVGRIVVNELLYRMRDTTKFVTVSGQVHNGSNPEGLYRKCGFTGADIWHILYKI